MGSDGVETLVPVSVILALVTSMFFLFRAVPWRKRGPWRRIWILASISALMVMLAEVAAVTIEGTHASGVTFQAPIFVGVLAAAAGFFVVYTDALRAAESDRILSLSDARTGLPNARAFQERLRLSFEVRGRQPFTVMYADLDGFKKVNDVLGHGAGDDVLKRVAAIFREAVRQQDMVARVGGDEFAFVLPGAEAQAVRAIAERALRALDAMELSGGLRVGASFGAASSRQAADVAGIVALADQAMYTAKRAGGRRVGFAGSGSEMSLVAV